MRKLIYYFLLIVLWIAIVLILALLLVTTGLFSMPAYGFSAQLGGACAHPQLWVVAIGIVLLLRPFVYKMITKESKRFEKTISVTILAIGIVWLTMVTISRIVNRNVSEQLIEQYEKLD